MFQAKCECSGCGKIEDVKVARYGSCDLPKEWSNVELRSDGRIFNGTSYHFCPECAKKLGFEKKVFSETEADAIVNAIYEIACAAVADLKNS